MTDIEQTWWIACISWLGCIVAFVAALFQWDKGQKITRAEFLERLIEKFKAINYDEYLRKLERPAPECPQDSELFDDGISAHDFLSFLTYVCYLKNADIINDDEFTLFRCYVKRALRLEAVKEYLAGFHAKDNLSLDESPYMALMKCGEVIEPDVMTGIRENVANRKGNAVKPEARKVEYGMTFKTHLDVLNGIFNKGLLQHASGGSPLDAETSVWFAHIRVRAEFENTLSDDGKELREKWCGEGERPRKSLRYPIRYVFAKFYKGKKATDYTFIGVFKFKCKEAGDVCVYECTAKSFEAR